MRKFVIFLTLIVSTLVSPVFAQDNPVITLENAAQLVPVATLEGHEGAVNSVAFSPDGTLLASGGTDTVVRLWNPTTGELTNELSGHTAPVFAVAFNSDGTQLASTGQDFSVPIWDVNTGEQLDDASVLSDLAKSMIGYLAGLEAAFRSVAWIPGIIESQIETPLAVGDVASNSLFPSNSGSSSDPNLYSITATSSGVIAEGTSTGIKLFFSGLDQSIDLTDHAGAVFDVEFSLDATLLASAGEDSTIRLWDITDQQNVVSVATLEGHQAAVTSISFSPDGTLLVSGSQDGTLRVWDVASQTEIASLSTPQTTEVYTVAFSLDGTRIASAGSDGVITFWGISG